MLCCFIHNAKRDEEKEILEECFKIETVFLKELSKGLWNFYKRIEVVINSEIEVMDYS